MAFKRKQSFLYGALVLVASSVLVNVLGAVFKIPLTILIKEEGMGLFNTSYTLFTFFVLAAKGFSIAVSKMVSESIALEKKREADRIFTVALVLLGILGAAGSILLYWGAQRFSGMLGNTKAALCIKAISPAVLFIALVSAFRGYFQGRQDMYPTAFSEVIEALGKLVIGMLLAWWFVGISIERAAAGAVAGVTGSTMLGLIFIVIVFVIDKVKGEKNGNENTRSIRGIIKRLLIISLPITIGASVASLTNVVDMMTIMNRLQSITNVTPEFITKYQSIINDGVAVGGITEDLANKLYGLYSGYAVLLFNLPLTMIVALSTSVLPAISAAITRRDALGAQTITKSVIRITILFALPCTVGLAVLAGPILQLILNNSLAKDLLRTISIAIVFVSIVQVTNAVLQAYGKMHIPVINMIIGGIVKIAFNYYFIGIASINIEGAPLGTIACYFVIAMLNLIYIARLTKAKFEKADFIFKPLFSAVGMGVIATFSVNAMLGVGIGEKIAVLPAIAIGAIVYMLLILTTGGITKSDVEMMPAGKRVAETLGKLHLLKG
ncbi:MAG: polysaccharide biosynthesis protein [Clostridiaceae bacterium]|nr:polysaccharide biosynthesis protein [Clostridiaceae bacterium]